jgi:hypothetical protein
MGSTHYYYALNRQEAEGILDLTWGEFLKEFGWRPGKNEWKTLGEFLAYSLDRPEIPDRPTPRQLAPILKWTIRKTILGAAPQYFVLLCLSYQLGRRSFVKADLEAEDLEDDCDAVLACAANARLRGSIDDRTLWAVLALHQGCGYMPEQGSLKLAARRGVINAACNRFGRCLPVFDWQPVRTVRDGHTALREEDTLLFARFPQLAWRKNWPVWNDEAGVTVRFRDFKLARMLWSSAARMRGQCIVRYWGD